MVHRVGGQIEWASMKVREADPPLEWAEAQQMAQVAVVNREVVGVQRKAYRAEPALLQHPRAVPVVEHSTVAASGLAAALLSLSTSTP